jgi:hypothetical protein
MHVSAITYSDYLSGEPDAGDPPVRFGGRDEVPCLIPTPIGRLTAGASAPVSALNRWGASPHSGLDLASIVESNCAAEMRGGEQLETNCWSAG